MVMGSIPGQDAIR